MNDKVVAEVLKRIDMLSTGLQQSGTKLSEYAVKWFMVYSITDFVASVLFLVATPFVMYGLWKLLKGIEEEEFRFIFSVVMFILTIIWLVFFTVILCNLPTAVANIACPQWGMVNHFIEGMGSVR